MDMNLAQELDLLVADARSHGLSQIDLAALERLLHRHSESLRRDLLQDTLLRRDLLS